jgi:preprotein translocase subunit SecA
MLKALVGKVLGSRHAREAKKLRPLVDEINEIAEELKSLSDDQLRAKTDEFRARIRDALAESTEKIAKLRDEKRHTEDAERRAQLSQEIGELEKVELEDIEDVLDEILPEAYAVVKSACQRLVGREVVFTGTAAVWDMVPYDVQLIGAIALHQGKVAEMATGEGKTLVATMPLYLNALAGRGAHLITVNSYLAQRDAEWMGAIYKFLGLTVDVIDLHEPGSPSRREAYRADITYGTNNEFGFDYLRDNMVLSLEQRVQRGHHFALIDEVDSILIDEARTPLIISGPVGRDTSTPFTQYNALVSNLYKKQSRVTGELVAEAEKDLAEGREYEAGEKLLAVKRGTPRHKRLLRLFADDPGIQKLVQRVEGDYMRDKRLHEIDEMLYFAMDERGHSVHLSDKGLDEMAPNDPDAFTVPDLSSDLGKLGSEGLSVEERRERMRLIEAEYAEKSQKVHVVHQLLKAYTLYQKDEKYIISDDGQIVIVDEFTGRQMAGRRWSDGLHQAVEAKEGVEVKGETQTLATITIQNYFRMYDKLGGMTGTAETEENEFHQIYSLDVMVIPTNRPIVRDDREDLIFRTKREKYNALMDEVERLHKAELPVLVGTTNVEVSETLSRMLKRRGIPHNVLNAKQHHREAEIVAQAGQPGQVTIATNMAGRGTDIKLGPTVKEPRTVGWAKQRGLEVDDLQPVDPTRFDAKLAEKGDDAVIEVGGLHVLGSERHEARRIDRQLRGRAGRQGDPAATQFFLSLEDDLMRLFGSDRIATAMQKMGAEEGEVITHALVTRSIGNAQSRVEVNNFEARKRLLDYDDVMNQQREVVYDLRLFALEGGEDLKGQVWEMIEATVDRIVEEHARPGDATSDWDLAGLKKRLLLDLLVIADKLPDENDPEHEFDLEKVKQIAVEAAHDAFHRKVDSFGEHTERVLSYLTLASIDDKWKDHLYDLDHLKASIGFRGWGQKDPLVEYKKEAYDMFVDLLNDLRSTLSQNVMKAQISVQAPRPVAPPRQLMFTGPSDAPETGVGGAGARPAAQDEEATGPAPAPTPRLDEVGISQRARAAASTSGIGSAGAGSGISGMRMSRETDMSKLSTNRGEDGEPVKAKPVAAEKTVGRNDPCPCGSGKKYKQCHGKS